MFPSPNSRVFAFECLYECARYFLAVDDIILDELAARLLKSVTYNSERRMTETEFKHQLRQFAESLRTLEHDQKKN